MLTNITYTSLDTHNIPQEVLDRIFEIEQDMWARWIGEYVECSTCDIIYSKEQVYGQSWIHPLSQQCVRETVMEIERQLGHSPKCLWCGWKMTHIYDYNSYIEQIQERYGREDAFLTVAYNSEDQIVWFMDWYIASLEEIFRNEFSFHFTEGLLEEIMCRYKLHRSQKLMTFSSLGTDDKNKSLFLIFSLIRQYFDSIPDDIDNISWLFESIIGSSTYGIFSIMWATKMELQTEKKFIIPWVMNEYVETDILFQENIVWRYRTWFNIRVRDVLRYLRSSQLLS